MSAPRASKRELVSQRELARRLGVSNVSVHEAVKSGRISTVKGKIDPVKAAKQWRENTDPSKPRNRITGRPKATRKKDEPSEPMDFGGGSNGTGSGYAKARAARELYQAQLSKLELDEKRGVLVRADEVRLGAFNMARKARDQLTALCERLAPILPPEAQRILEGEIERTCQEIADAERA